MFNDCYLAAIKCPEFPALENGWVEQQNRVVGGYATFKCYDKFMYSLPKQTLRCRPNGEWNGKNGTCDSKNSYSCNPTTTMFPLIGTWQLIL